MDATSDLPPLLLLRSFLFWPFIMVLFHIVGMVAFLFVR